MPFEWKLTVFLEFRVVVRSRIGSVVVEEIVYTLCLQRI